MMTIDKAIKTLRKSKQGEVQGLEEALDLGIKALIAVKYYRIDGRGGLLDLLPSETRVSEDGGERNG